MVMRRLATSLAALGLSLMPPLQVHAYEAHRRTQA
jgi:hypothetical protein